MRLLKDEVNERLGLSQALFHMARVSSLQKDYDRAYALYKESYAIASEMDNKLLIASCLEGLASLAAAQGKPILSAQLWGAAESLREAIEAPIPTIEREDNERSVATTRALMGDQAFNASWVEGKTMTPEQAFTSLISRMQSVTVVPSSTHSAKPSPRYPAGLTSREVEVLRLVAQGLTDAQVAEQLVISPRTVNTHLTSIYNKLGVNSRASAARFAVEQHLI